MGDWSGFMDKIHEVVPMDQQPELLQKLSEGNFTLRIMYEQFQNILKMGPISQVNTPTCLPAFLLMLLGRFLLDFHLGKLVFYSKYFLGSFRSSQCFQDLVLN